MPTRSLTLRRNQLALLREACDAGLTAAVYRRRGGAPPATPNTKLLALTDEDVWIQAPVSGLLPAHWDGAIVDVCFERGGLTYRFTAETCGRYERRFQAVGDLATLRLTLPIRVERCDPRERRENVRVRLDDALNARLVHMTNKHQQLDLQLRDVSLGGCAGRMSSADIEQVDRGTPYWAEFELEPDEPPIDFVVQLVHYRPDAENAEAVVGWRFCPGDDELGYRASLQRLQDFVERRRPPA